MLLNKCTCLTISIFIYLSDASERPPPVTASNLLSVEKLQQHNLEILTATLPHGWKAFCDSPVDEGVMSLYNGIAPSDATIHVLTLNNQSIELPIKALSEIRDFDINPKRKTLLYVNAAYTPDTYFSVKAHLKLLQVTRRDLNVILVDFASDVQQLYYAVRHHVTVLGYFVAKILTALVENGVAAEDITLAGHSIGANIAALGANIYTAQGKMLASHRSTPLGQLIAIDPAQMCQPSDVFVGSQATNESCSRVVVLHGEGELFGVRDPLGTIDIYPNGVGVSRRRTLQPGCETALCSHMYPFVLFMEALIEGVEIPAVRCESWSQFRNHSCDYADTVLLGLRYPDTARGLYFCMTQPNPPFTFMEHGLRYRHTKTHLTEQ